MSKFRIFILGVILWLSAACACLAQQSAPNWSYGYTPTPAEWNHWFGVKTDWPGAASCTVTGCTMTGPIITAPSTAGAAGFSFTPGVNVTSPNYVDMWVTGTAPPAYYLRINATGMIIYGSTSGTGTFQVANTGSVSIGNNQGGQNTNFFDGANGTAASIGNAGGSTIANFIGLQPAVATSGPIVQAFGTDTNINLRLLSKGNGNVTVSNATGTGLVVTGTANATPAAGQVLISGNSSPTLATNGTAAIWALTGNGLAVAGQGSVNDITLENSNNAAVLQVPTGSTQADFPGAFGSTIPTSSLGVSGANSSNPTFGGNGSGAVYTSTTAGAVLSGQGSSNDVAIRNRSSLNVMTVPTGTLNANFSANITQSGSTSGSFTLTPSATGGHPKVVSSSVPTLTAGCNGTGSVVSGTDTHGTITGQTAVATTCTLTFGTTYSAAPDCVASGQSSPLTGAITVSTSTLVVNFASTANFKWSYICLGN